MNIFVLMFLLSFQLIVNASVFDSQIDIFKLTKEKNDPFPVLSEKHSFIPYSSAYQFQKEWVDYLSLSNKKTGYKAGLTSVNSQKKYKTDSPIFGVLVPEKTYENFDIIPISSFHHLFVEAELGFELKADIKTPIETTYSLKKEDKKSVRAVAELPDIKFNELGSFQLVDLIMINSGSNTYILGSEININDVNDISVEFKHNDKTIFTETSNIVMADQYESLKWLIKQLLNHGYELKKR